MEKIPTTEEFYYEGEKIEKGTLLEVYDSKKGFSRSGILVEVKIPLREKSIRDWVDVSMIFPMKNHFVLPRGTSNETIDELREGKLSDDDRKMFNSWQSMIENGESYKVIKSISTRTTSDKFGI
jgi:hypothetical protein